MTDASQDIKIDIFVDGVQKAEEAFRQITASARRMSESIGSYVRNTGIEKLSLETARVAREMKEDLGQVTKEIAKAKGSALKPEPVKLSVETEGVQNVQRDFKAISSGAERMSGTVQSAVKDVSFKELGEQARQAAQQISGAFGRDLGNIRGLTLTGLGAGFAGAVAGALAFQETLQTLRQAAEEAAREVTRLEGRGRALDLKAYKGITDSRAETMGALEYTLKAVAGLDDGDNLKDIVSTLIETVVLASKGEEAEIKKLEALGINNPKLFYLPGTNELRDVPEMLELITEASKKLTQQQRIAGAIGIFGDDDGQAVAAMLDATKEELRGYMSEYARYVGMRQSDTKLSKDLVASLSAEEAAWLGLKLSVERGYGPALIGVTRGRADFMTTIREDVEGVAKVFGDFRTTVEGHLQSFAADVLKSMRGAGDTISGGPIPAALDVLSGYIKTALDGVAELISYIATGQTEAPWLQSLIEILTSVKEAAVGVKDFLVALYTSVRDDVIPAITPVLEWIDTLLERMGADTIGEKAGVLAGLFLFKNTLATIVAVSIPALIGGIGSITGAFSGLGSAAGAAATAITSVVGAAGSIVAAGAGAEYFGIQGMSDTQFAMAAKEYYANAGEAAAGAFWIANEKAMELKGTGWSTMAKAVSALSWAKGDVTLGDARELSKEAMKNATPEQIKRAFADAFAIRQVKLEAPLEVAAGVTISQIDIDESAKRAIEMQYADLHIKSILNLDDIKDSLQKTVDSVTMSINPNYDHDFASKLQREGEVRGTPVVLQLPDGSKTPALYGTQSDVQRIIQETGFARRLTP